MNGWGKASTAREAEVTSIKLAPETRDDLYSGWSSFNTVAGRHREAGKTASPPWPQRHYQVILESRACPVRVPLGSSVMIHPKFSIQFLLTAVLLEFPIAVVKGTDLPGLEPAGDAVEVEGMLSRIRVSKLYSKMGAKPETYVADSPGDRTFLACS